MTMRGFWNVLGIQFSQCNCTQRSPFYTSWTSSDLRIDCPMQNHCILSKKYVFTLWQWYLSRKLPESLCYYTNKLKRTTIFHRRPAVCQASCKRFSPTSLHLILWRSLQGGRDCAENQHNQAMCHRAGGRDKVEPSLSDSNLTILSSSQSHFVKDTVQSCPEHSRGRWKHMPLGMHGGLQEAGNSGACATPDLLAHSPCSLNNNPKGWVKPHTAYQ